MRVVEFRNKEINFYCGSFVKVLVLSPYTETISQTFAAAGDQVVHTEERFDASLIHEEQIEYLVSYGYQFLLGDDILSLLPQKAINLHISYLPWNRGRDPNFWSFFDKTPKGVSIHQIDHGIDTGNVLAQITIEFGLDETLTSSYFKLRREIEKLFSATWKNIRSGHLKGKPQPRAGSYHKAKDKEPIFSTLPDGWETPVHVIENLGEEHRRVSGFEKEDIS